MLPHFLPLVDPTAENRHPKWPRETSHPASRASGQFDSSVRQTPSELLTASNRNSLSRQSRQLTGSAGSLENRRARREGEPGRKTHITPQAAIARRPQAGPSTSPALPPPCQQVAWAHAVPSRGLGQVLAVKAAGRGNLNLPALTGSPADEEGELASQRHVPGGWERRAMSTPSCPPPPANGHHTGPGGQLGAGTQKH